MLAMEHVGPKFAPDLLAVATTHRRQTVSISSTHSSSIGQGFALESSMAATTALPETWSAVQQICVALEIAVTGS
jgi:hypothetical protein